MVTMNNATTQTPSPTQQNILNLNNEKKMSEYERCREERIKENFERMKKLGIFDLSLKLKASAKPTRKYNNASSSSVTPQRDSPISRHVGPVRRSSRLGNATPVSYSELPLSKKGSFETEEELLRKGPKPEVYTEDQLKLLGCTNTSWTLFVDGYGKDGKRIYDQINGKTCHQCRQKTLGYRTQCIQCCKVQGQFCGDCLYMRYGENVLEALQNPDWVCPVCRGICNCSLCRNAKGWAPTGMMYKKVIKLGFKSVAHYLLETAIDREKEGTKVPVSAKRSLAFSSTEATSINMESAVSVKISADVVTNKEDGVQHTENEHCDSIVAKNTETREGSVKISADVVTNKGDGVQHTENEHCNSIVAKNTETREGSVKISADVVTNKGDGVQHTENEHCDSIVAKNTETREGSVKISADVVTNKGDGVQHTENEHCNSIVAKNTETREGSVKISADVVTNKGDGVQHTENEHCDSIVAKNTETREGSVKISADVVTNKGDGVQHTENEHCNSIVAKNTETREGSVKISADVVTNKGDGVQHTENEHCDSIVAKNTETREGSVKISADVVTNKGDGVQHTENEHCDSIVAKNNTASKRKTPIRSEPMADSIGARLRAAKRSADVVTNKEDSVQYLENKHCDSSVAKNTTASKRKMPKSSELMPESIGARLRARRRIC